MPANVPSTGRPKKRVKRWIQLGVLVLTALIFFGPIYRFFALGDVEKQLYSACRQYLDADRKVCDIDEGDDMLTLWNVIDSTERRLASQERDLLSVFVDLNEGGLSPDGKRLLARTSERRHPQEASRLRSVIREIMPKLDKNKEGHTRLWHEAAQILTTLDKLEDLWSTIQGRLT